MSFLKYISDLLFPISCSEADVHRKMILREYFKHYFLDAGKQWFMKGKMNQTDVTAPEVQCGGW